MRYLWMTLGLWACGGTEPLDGGALGAGGMIGDSGPIDGSTADGGRADGGAADVGPGPEAALLARPIDPQMHCTVAAPLRNLSPYAWSFGSAAAVTRGGQVVLVREESRPPNPFDWAPAYLTVGVLGGDGSLGSEPVFAESQAGYAPPTAVAVNDRLYVAWTQESGVYFSRELPDSYSQPRRLNVPYVAGYYVGLVAGHGALALVWEDQDINTGETRYRWARLSLDGDILGAPQVLATDMFRTPPVLLPTAEGWVAFMRRDEDLVLKFLSAEGAEQAVQTVARGGDNQVGRGVGFDRGQLALVALDSGYVAAWVESNPGGFDSGTAFSGVRLARLSADGNLLGEPIWVRAPEFDINEVEPRLHRVGNKVALTWGRGSHIYICAGCVPDHRVDLVWFDPERWVPLSAVVSITPPPGIRGGGILKRAEGWTGEHLVMGVGLTFHVHAEPATAAFRCVEN